MLQASEPVLMCSLPGYDASSRVDDLATQLNRQITSIAIGSSEGFEQVKFYCKKPNMNAKTIEY